MVIATSGSGFVDYNKIISESISPFRVVFSEAYRYETSGKEVHSIYIIDEVNLVSLYHETSSGKTEIANLNLFAEKISF